MGSPEIDTVAVRHGNNNSAQSRSPQSSPSCRIWTDNDAAFSMGKVCVVRHNYHEHPLMQLDSLERLAKSLMPSGQCRFLMPGATQSLEFNHEPQRADGRGIEEVFRRIEEPGSWIALYNVETDPLYARFLQDALGTVRHLIDREQPGMFSVGGFIFISAPPSITPFHIDKENNFWLQIRGRKTINVWEPTDRQAVAAQDVEDFIVRGTLEGVRLQEEMVAHSHNFSTAAGDGVYLPSTSPHMTRCDATWAKPGDGVSISIGMVFYTNVTRRRAYVHAFNNKILRRLGVQPILAGHSPWVDNVKYPVALITEKFIRRWRGYSLPTGF